MKPKLASRLHLLLLLLSVVIPLCFLFNNLSRFSSLPLVLSVLLIITLAGVFITAPSLQQSIKHHARAPLSAQNFTPIIISATLILATSIRLFFFFRFSYAPTSDPMYFFDSAQSLALGQGFGDNTFSVAFFPYLAAYSNILNLAMRIVSDPWLATILLNSAIDIAGATILYFFIKKLSKPESKLPILGFAIWVLNPFNIIFSILSLPIIIVNFFIVATIFLTYLLAEKVKTLVITQSLLLAITLGLTIGFGNMFRPIFAITLIALFIYFAYILLTNPWANKLFTLAGFSFAIIVGLYFSLQYANFAFVSHQTGISAARDSSGWSIFVGANHHHTGRWNESDTRARAEICDGIFIKAIDNDKCHRQLRDAGIARYENLGTINTVRLLRDKLRVFTSTQNYMYNARDSIIDFNGSQTSRLISTSILAYVITISLLTIYALAKLIKDTFLTRKITPITIFILLLMLGFFFSSMFVEAAHRYAQIMYPYFIIFAVLSLSSSRDSNAIPSVPQ